MRIPFDAIIPEKKLTRYLLIPRARDDKSKFLAQAGFTQENLEALLAALRLLVDSTEFCDFKASEVLRADEILTVRSLVNSN